MDDYNSSPDKPPSESIGQKDLDEIQNMLDTVVGKKSEVALQEQLVFIKEASVQKPRKIVEESKKYLEPSLPKKRSAASLYSFTSGKNKKMDQGFDSELAADRKLEENSDSVSDSGPRPSYQPYQDGADTQPLPQQQPQTIKRHDILRRGRRKLQLP